MALYALSRNYQKHGELELAERYKQQAINTKDSHVLLMCGCECIKHGHRKQAEQYLGLLATQNEPLATLALMIAEEDMQKALAFASAQQLATKASNGTHSWMTTLAHISFLMGKYTHADTCYQKAIEWGIGNHVHSDIAYFYAKRKEYKKAILEYITAIEHNEQSEIHYRMGKIYYTRSQLEFAQMVLESRFDDKTKNDTLLLALVYFDQGNLHKCKLCLQQAGISLSRSSGTQTLASLIKDHKQLDKLTLLLEQVALAHIQHGQYEEAQEHLQSIVKLGTATDQTFQHLNVIHTKLGKASQKLRAS
jgi:tetratricopeptide (TPR) repeat protein